MPDFTGLDLSFDELNFDAEKTGIDKGAKQFLQNRGYLEKDGDFYNYETDQQAKERQFRTEDSRRDYIKNPGILNTLGRGFARGTDNLQASAYGIAGLFGDLIGSEGMKDFGLKGFTENQREASETYVPIDSFIGTDEKGAFGSVGNFAKAVPQAIGEALPSILEAIGFGIAGGIAGSQAVPGVGPDDVVAVPAGAVTGIFAKGAIKNYIKRMAGEKGVSEAVIKNSITPALEKKIVSDSMKSLGAKVGSGLAVGFTESGSNFADLSVNSGIDAPMTSLMFGMLSGASEGMFGASADIMKSFMRSPLSSAVRSQAKKHGMKKAAGWMWDVMKGSAEEGAQEAFQGFLSSLNKEVNDPNFEITSKETFMEWLEQAAAGALVGGPTRGATSLANIIRGDGNSPITENKIEGPGDISVPSLDLEALKKKKQTRNLTEQDLKDFLNSEPTGITENDILTREEAYDQGERSRLDEAHRLIELGVWKPSMLNAERLGKGSLKDFAEGNLREILNNPEAVQMHRLDNRESFVNYLFESGVVDSLSQKLKGFTSDQLSDDKAQDIMAEAVRKIFPDSQADQQQEQSQEPEITQDDLVQRREEYFQETLNDEFTQREADEQALNEDLANQSVQEDVTQDVENSAVPENETSVNQEKVEETNINESLQDVNKSLDQSQEKATETKPAEENPNNPYLSMPIEKVKSDAEHGVALAKEALEVRQSEIEESKTSNSEFKSSYLNDDRLDSLDLIPPRSGNERTLEIDKIQVKEDFRNKGLGRKILKDLFDKNKNIDAIEAYPLTDSWWIKQGVDKVLEDGTMRITRESFNKVDEDSKTVKSRRDNRKKRKESKEEKAQEESKNPEKMDSKEFEDLVEKASKEKVEVEVNIPKSAFADIAKRHEGSFSDPVYKDYHQEVYGERKKKVIIGQKVKDELLSKDEARARIDKWIETAKKEGKTSKNASKTILSLFDRTGMWSGPYVEAGYNVIQIDIENGQDIMKIDRQWLDDNGIDEIHGVLAACPCTDFAGSGARWWKGKDADGRTQASIDLVDQTITMIEMFRPKFWALENPVGRIQRLAALPDPRLTFHPHHFGDDYTKKTMLWGNFNTDLPTANVHPDQGSKMHKLRGDDPVQKAMRSITPEGFAYSFFMANSSVSDYYFKKGDKIRGRDPIADEFKEGIVSEDYTDSNYPFVMIENWDGEPSFFDNTELIEKAEDIKPTVKERRQKRKESPKEESKDLSEIYGNETLNSVKNQEFQEKANEIYKFLDSKKHLKRRTKAVKEAQQELKDLERQAKYADMPIENLYRSFLAEDATADIIESNLKYYEQGMEEELKKKGRGEERQREAEHHYREKKAMLEIVKRHWLKYKKLPDLSKGEIILADKSPAMKALDDKANSNVLSIAKFEAKELTELKANLENQSGRDATKSKKKIKELEKSIVDSIEFLDERDPDKAEDLRNITGLKTKKESKKKESKKPEDKPKNQEKIEDFGEKIGGARKDMALKGQKRVKSEVEKDERPGWKKRYKILQEAIGPNAGKFVVADTRKKSTRRGMSLVGGYRPKVFDSEAQAEAAIPLIEFERNHSIYGNEEKGYTIYRRISDRKTKAIVGGFKTREEALKYADQNTVSIIETKTRFDHIRPEMLDVIREGKDYLNGKPATPKMFNDTFGFRGVEFGNWNNKDERQLILNHAYNAFMDLSKVLDIPTKAISLNGDLAIGFGSRGRGLSGASAHYERDYGAINLTKLKGSGALAHEWFHAFDHYMARLDSKASSEKQDNRFIAGTPRTDYMSHGSSYKTQLRKEVVESYKKVMQTIFHKSESYKEDTMKSEETTDRFKLTLEKKLDDLRAYIMKDYTDSKYAKRHLKPATEAQLKEFDQLAKDVVNLKGTEQEWISTPSRFSRMGGRMSTQTLEKISALVKKVRGRAEWGKNQKMHYLNAALRSYESAQNRLKEAQQGKEKTRKVRTEFYQEAGALDQGTVKDYWSTDHEMAARAFESYVHDKIGEKSQFLTAGVTNDHYLLLGVKPYPEGQERKNINKSFDDLFKVIESRETDKGVELYREDSNISNDLSQMSEADKEVVMDIVEAMTGKKDVKFAEQLFSKTGQEVFGKYKDQFIEISEKKGDWNNTARHEAMHFVYDLLLTEKERNQFDIDTDQLGLTHEQAIEKVNEFARENTGGIANKIKRWSRKMVRRVRALFGADRAIDRLNEIYDQSLSGKLADRGVTGQSNYQGQNKLFRSEEALNGAMSKDAKKVSDSWDFKGLAKSFFKNMKKDDKNAKTDVGFSRFFRNISFFSETIPAMKRLFDAGNKLRDDKVMIERLMFNEDNGNGASNFESLVEFSKKNKKEWEKLSNDYLWKRDRDQTGYSVKEYNGTFTLVDPKNKELGVYSSESEAWANGFKAEYQDMLKDGWSVEAANAVMHVRKMMSRQHALLSDSLNKLEQEAKELGIQNPTIGEVKLFDLRAELKKMGDLRGSYMPRLRTGRYLLWAKKPGENPRLETFDTKIGRSARSAILEKQGYQVNFEVSNQPSQDAFLQGGNISAIEDLVNNSLIRADKENNGLDSLDVENEVVTYKDKGGSNRNNLVVKGENAKKYALVLESFGATKEGETWVFKNKSKSKIELIQKSLAGAMHNFNGKKVLEFEAVGKALAEQMAVMFHSKGSQSRKISRDGRKGSDVFLGFEEDALKALSMSITATAGGTAKRNMTRSMIEAISGRDLKWQDYLKENIDPSIKEGTEAYYDAKIELWPKYREAVIERSIQSDKQPEAFKESLSYMQDMQRNEEGSERIMGRFRAFAAFKYLSSFSSGLINLTALPTVAPGAMSTFAGIKFKQAVRLLPRAAKDYTKYMMYHKFGKGEDLKGEDKFVYDEIVKRGWDADLMNQEAMGVTRTWGGKITNTIMETGMFVFGVTEKVNRASMIAASYKGMVENHTGKLTDADREKYLETAKRVSDKANGVYGKANLPSVARGSSIGGQTLRSAYMFRTYLHNYLQLLHQVGFKEKDFKAFAWMLLSPAIVGGTAATVPHALVTALAGMTGVAEPEELEEEFYKYIREFAGENAEDLARFGLAGQAGISLKGSLAIGTELPTKITDLFGASYSAVNDFATGISQIASGDTQKGFENALPRILSNILKSQREYSEGVTNSKNQPIYFGNERVKASGYEAFARFFGFNPVRIAEIREKQWKDSKIERKYSAEKSEIYKDIRRFLLDGGSKAEWIEHLKVIEDYNARVNRTGNTNISQITPRSIRGVIQAMKKGNRREALRAKEQSGEIEDRELPDFQDFNIEDEQKDKSRSVRSRRKSRRERQRR